MKQAIAGVAPAQLQETRVATVWPSVSMFSLGRMLGRWYAVSWPDIHILRLGNLIALACSPIGALLYFCRLHPRVALLAQWPCREEDINPDNYFGIAPIEGRSYRLTNRRVLVLRNELLLRIGLVKIWLLTLPLPTFKFEFEQEVKSIHLDRFDSIEIETQPGQEWYKAGDLVFRDGNVETFRLSAVPRPEIFRETCLKSHMAYVGVKKAQQAQQPEPALS